jgi:hypothetical protein
MNKSNRHRPEFLCALFTSQRLTDQTASQLPCDLVDAASLRLELMQPDGVAFAVQAHRHLDACTSYLALKPLLHHPRAVTANMSSNTKTANLFSDLLSCRVNPRFLVTRSKWLLMR